MGSKKRMNLKTFVQINEEVSSEMVTTVMGAIHDNMPCSRNIFRMISNYVENVSDEEELNVKDPEE